MNDGILRMLERLQTGWGPDTREIRVPQRDLLRWSWWSAPREQQLYLRGEDIDGAMVVVAPIWIDRRFEWAVTAEEFVWLYDDEESVKMRYLGD
jgi:hypothetical protein